MHCEKSFVKDKKRDFHKGLFKKFEKILTDKKEIFTYGLVLNYFHKKTSMLWSLFRYYWSFLYGLLLCLVYNLFAVSAMLMQY